MSGIIPKASWIFPSFLLFFNGRIFDHFVQIYYIVFNFFCCSPIFRKSGTCTVLFNLLTPVSIIFHVDSCFISIHILYIQLKTSLRTNQQNKNLGLYSFFFFRRTNQIFYIQKSFFFNFSRFSRSKRDVFTVVNPKSDLSGGARAEIFHSNRFWAKIFYQFFFNWPSGTFV